MSSSTVELEGYDPIQVSLMSEKLIFVSPSDVPIFSDTKVEGHLMSNINPPKSLLHRAFSVFLFERKDGKLLLQKRADEKITFPGMWTNTCCSHPLWVGGEMVEENQLGVRRAAQRKLFHELGIPLSESPLEDFVYLTRIHYLAPSDGKWGEHEIDYVLFLLAPSNLTLKPEPNEVSDTKFVSKLELESMFSEPSNSFTPWFKLIAKSFLYEWWDKLVEGGDPVKGIERVRKEVVERVEEMSEIKRMV